MGTNIIVLLAGLQGIPEEIYEAARLDGARGARMFTRITVPMVSPSLFFLLVVDTVASLPRLKDQGSAVTFQATSTSTPSSPC